MLGNMEEDEVCFQQLYLALQKKFGREVVFKNVSTRGMMQAKDGYYLMQVCLQRVAASSIDELDLAIENERGLWVHQAHTVGDDHDEEWLHTVLFNRRTKKFYCHNLEGWYGQKHLDLRANGQTGGKGYLRHVHRVYSLSISKRRRSRRK
jgi:hypothetical protein